jgi:serine/threonine-protein kinase RsbW
LNPQIFSKKFSSSTDVLPEIENFVMKISTGFGLYGNRLSRFALAASEAASNSIVHGNKLDKNKDISVELCCVDNIIELKISDKGKGFDPEKVPDPTVPENILKDSGRGIFIMKSFLTDLQYKFSPDGTSTILILKI